MGGEPDIGAPFRLVGEETAHRARVISVTHATFVDPDGTRFERDIVRHPGAVAVVAVTDGGSVLLVAAVPPGRRPVDPRDPRRHPRRRG